MVLQVLAAQAQEQMTVRVILLGVLAKLALL
jgi:hypothetical protein